MTTERDEEDVEEYSFLKNKQTKKYSLGEGPLIYLPNHPLQKILWSDIRHLKGNV